MLLRDKVFGQSFPWIWVFPSVFTLVFYKLLISSKTWITLSAIIWFLLNMKLTIHWYFTRFFCWPKYLSHGCIDIFSHQYASIDVLPDFSLVKRQLSYWLHKYDLSPMCIPWCFTSFWFQVKAFSHWLQWYGFSPVCLI